MPPSSHPFAAGAARSAYLGCPRHALLPRAYRQAATAATAAPRGLPVAVQASGLGIDLTGKRAFVAGVADDQGFGWAISKARTREREWAGLVRRAR